ncbi:hypothetical protein AWG51_11070 [Escherichia coli]|uniref:homocysteine S-methyltransferase family protein n=1 Tax=Escherichia coli TaxID=562 RepID=UPI0007B481B9|nr:homocysteine S-methyltransferase family protein [Escherichia coli]KZH65116.1 hypothetical protein AWG51_11070 [Escherichia coli]
MSQNNPLRALLDKQDILLLDGAMATELEARGCNLADSLWSAKVLVENPELIREVHLDYYRAGPQYEVTVEWHGQEILLQVNATRLQPDVGEQYYLEIHPYGMFVLADAA